MFELLEDINYKQHDTKKIFYFYILKSVCDCMLESSGNNRCVFFYNDNCIDRYKLQFIEHSDIHQYRVFFTSLVRKMNSILPTLFYIISDDRCFKELSDNIETGEYLDISNDIIAARRLKSNKRFTFERAKNFVKRYGLTYLDKEYFNKVKIKTLLYR